MIKKIQIIVKVSEIDSVSDYTVPADMKIAEAALLIAKILFPSGHPAFERLQGFALFDLDRQTVCPAEMTAAECGLTRGSTLLLV